MEDYEIGRFDKSFKAWIGLDVHLVKLNAVCPGEGHVEEMVDLLRGYVDDDGLVVSFGHELLAEVRSDEATAANHAYR